MKKYLVSILVLLSFCERLSAGAPSLTVILSKPTIFFSQNNKAFSVRYGDLSDNSLSFIKITFPDGIENTLPKVPSASGVRYLDDRDLEWWEQQGSVCLSKRDDRTQEWLRCHWKLKTRS